MTQQFHLSASYIPANKSFIFPSALLSIWPIVRSGWLMANWHEIFQAVQRERSFGEGIGSAHGLVVWGLRYRFAYNV